MGLIECWLSSTMRWMDKIPICRCLHHCCCHGSKGATVDNGVKDGDCYLYCVNGFVRYMIGGKDSYRYICFERPRRCKTGRLEAPMRLSKHELSKERESDATVAIGRYMVHHRRGMTHRDPSTRSLPNICLNARMLSCAYSITTERSTMEPGLTIVNPYI